MDIELLSKMIGELVPERTEVGLPGLGSFVSEFVPASFSDRGYTINPPYKRVSFVPGTSEDDSLVNLYASSNDLDYDQAKAILQHFLEGIKKVLMDKKTVVLPGLGRLRATRQNNFFFISDETLDIYPEGFGLNPLSLKNQEESPAQVRHMVESLADILVEPADVPEPAPQATDGLVAEDPENLIAEEPEQFAEALEGTEASEEADSIHQAVEAEEVPFAKTVYETPESRLKKAEYCEPELKLRKAKYSRPRSKARRKLSKWVWLAPLLLVALAALALAVFMILVQVSPDFVDSLLYTPEELRIINY